MDEIEVAGVTLTGLCKINVILGKNGCGKSHLLKLVEGNLNRASFGVIRYISPERAGTLVYDPGLDQTVGNNPDWINNNRRRNQSDNFRQQSATLFRRLELLVLREIEVGHQKEGYKPRTFNTTIDQLNTLLDRVRLERDPVKAFRIIDKEANTETNPDQISSGETELISLGIEFLVFASESAPGKENILFVDEPDVHLHPDLQNRLAKFMASTIKDRPIKLVLATHSTSLLAGLADGYPESRVAFMRRGDASLAFRTVSEVDRAVLPIFGAHPLSSVFNESPPFLVEGEDDERVWQQAVRTSNGKLRIYPCPVDSIVRLAEYEAEVNNIIQSVYDNAIAFSLRDRDVQPEMINDVGRVVRMRLSCRAAENLMLSDDVLRLLGIGWVEFQARVQNWVAGNAGHPYFDEVNAFVAAGLARKTFDIKAIRNILIGLITSKPWEVAVGQAIARLVQTPTAAAPDSLRDYLGSKLCERVLRLSPP